MPVGFRGARVCCALGVSPGAGARQERAGANPAACPLPRARWKCLHSAAEYKKPDTKEHFRKDGIYLTF